MYGLNTTMKVADFIYFLNLRGILFSQPQDWLHLKLGSLLVMEWLPGIIGLHISSHSIRKRRGSFPMIFPQRERKKNVLEIPESISLYLFGLHLVTCSFLKSAAVAMKTGFFCSRIHGLI